MQIELLNTADFDRVYHLMQLSFPPEEFRPYRQQKALLNRSEYQIHVFKDDSSQQIQGFIAVWDFDSLVFIEHIAVDPAYRNGGIGAKLVNYITNLFGTMVCLEVEPPDDELSYRRIEFYKRNHFFFNPYPYVQPSISEGKKPIPLFIMTSQRLITETEFEQIKTLLYTQVYQVQ